MLKLKKQKTSESKMTTKSKKSSEKSSVVRKRNYTQDLLPIEKIEYGLIKTTDGTYCKLLEVMPLNFFNKTTEVQNNISDRFATMFRSNVTTMQVKIVSDKANPSNFLNKLEKFMRNEKIPERQEWLKDQIELVSQKAFQGVVLKRIFISLEYSGKAKKIEEIYTDMADDIAYVVSTLEEMGNFIVDYDNENECEAEIMYMLLNRTSSRTDPLQARILRLNNDTFSYNKKNKTEKISVDNDFLATRGIEFFPTFYTMDGMFYTNLILKTNTYPELVNVGWCSVFTKDNTENIDIDIKIRQVPRQQAVEYLKQHEKFSFFASLLNRDESKEEDKAMEHYNDIGVLKMLRNGENIYDVSIIFTIKADRYDDMKRITTQVKKRAADYDLHFTTPLFDCKDIFLDTLPLNLERSVIVKRNRHNFLTEELGGLYDMTASQFYDPNGIFLGTTLGTSRSITVIDFFNTQMFSNGCISIWGTPGMGKTFLMELIGTRAAMQGMRVNYIIPQKGRKDFFAGTKNMKGSFIQIGPSYTACLNILAIRPRQDDTITNKSLLAQKVTSIITFIQLLMGNVEMTMEEENKLNSCIVNMYKKFGITDDNNSIYEEDGSLKEMPILSNLAAAIKQEDDISRLAIVLDPFINGSYKNFNQQTNVDTENYYTVWDVDSDVIPAKIFPAIMYIVFDYVYELVKSSRTIFDLLFIDEAWFMMKNKKSAEQIDQCLRIIRSYAGLCCIATQQVKELFESAGGYGETILTIPQIKILLSMNKYELEKASLVCDLTESDKTTIKNLQRGCALFYSQKEKFFLHFDGSQKDINSFTTDPRILAQLEQQSTT